MSVPLQENDLDLFSVLTCGSFLWSSSVHVATDKKRTRVLTGEILREGFPIVRHPPKVEYVLTISLQNSQGSHSNMLLTCLAATSSG